VFWNQTALNILKKKAKTRSINNDLEFFGNCRTKLNNCDFIRALKRAVKKAGINDFTWQG